MSSAVLTVFGATGNQGGSVIKSVLAHSTLSSKYKIRGVTRDASKPASQALIKQGVEMVEADMSDKSSIEKAIKGSTAVFSVTDFWTHMSKDIEVQHGKSIADASKLAGVKLLIWSGLPHVTNTSKGQYKHVLHFDGKAEVSEYIESIKGNNMKAVYCMPAVYMNTFLTFVQGPDSQTGDYTIGLPLGEGDETQVPYLDTEVDTGNYVAAILASNDVDSLNGKHIQAVSQWLTPNQAAKELSKATGKTFNYRNLPADVWATFLPPEAATELKENMLFIRDFSYYGKGSEKKQQEQDDKLSLSAKSNLGQWAKASGKWQ